MEWVNIYIVRTDITMEYPTVYGSMVDFKLSSIQPRYVRILLRIAHVPGYQNPPQGIEGRCCFVG